MKHVCNLVAKAFDVVTTSSLASLLTFDIASLHGVFKTTRCGGCLSLKYPVETGAGLLKLLLRGAGL